LSQRRNSCSDVDARTSSGRLFQTAGAAAAKALRLWYVALRCVALRNTGKRA